MGLATLIGWFLVVLHGKFVDLLHKMDDESAEFLQLMLQSFFFVLL